MIFKKRSKYYRKIKNLSPWFHNLHLPDGTQTAPDHFLGDFPFFKWNEIQLFVPENLSGKKVLDIGCNAGFYSFEMAKRGADVLGIDLDPHYLKQAKWAAKVFKLEKHVSFKQMQVYDLPEVKDKFDIIIFMGVFYHLRYPMLALDIISQKTDGIIIFQTLTMPGNEVIEVPEDIKINERDIMKEPGYPLMAFIEKKLAGDPTNWWAPNHSAVISMMRSSGFKLTSHPGHEIYFFEKDKDLNHLNNWNSSEFLSATGKNWKKELQKKVDKK